MKLGGNRIRTSRGKIMHFKSKKKLETWERLAKAFKHGWRPRKAR